MNSQFQKPSSDAKDGRSSAVDPPYASGEMPGARSPFPTGGGSPSGREASIRGGESIGRSTSEPASKSSPSGSEALLDETQDAVAAAADSIYAASGAIGDASAKIG